MTTVAQPSTSENLKFLGPVENLSVTAMNLSSWGYNVGKSFVPRALLVSYEIFGNVDALFSRARIVHLKK